MNQHVTQINEELNLKEIMGIINKYKLSILIITILSIALVYIYLYFQPSIYRSSALIEVKSNMETNIISNENSSPITIDKEKIDKEIEILKTFYVNNSVINHVNLKVHYYLKNGYKKVEIYKKVPLNINHINIFDNKILGQMIKLTPNKNGYTLSVETSLIDNLSNADLHLDKNITFAYDKVIETEYFALSIEKNHSINQAMYFTLSGDNKHIFDRIKSNLIIYQVTKSAPLIRVEFEDNILERADKYVNTLVDSFIQQSIEDKGKKTDKIIEFIDEQLKETKNKLNEYESKLEEYKIKNDAIQPSLQGSNFINELSKIENKITDYTLKKKLIINILSMAKKKESIDSITTSLMKLDDEPTMSLINKLQEIQIREEELRAKYSYAHPSLRPIKKQIYHIRKNIIKNIKNLNIRVNQKILSLKKQKKSYKSKLDSLPTKERRLVGLKRDYEVSSKIYNHLLKKRSENQMIKVAIQSDYRVIDYAKNTQAKPVSPKRLFSLILGAILGLILGIFIAYLRNYFDDKIQSKHELEATTSLPIYGILPEVKKGKLKMEVIENPKSPYAESFRSLRTNLQFTQNKNEAHTILITSTVMGEGKSTTTANLSAIFHLAGYKCIVINLDMRKPTLHRYFNVSNSIGMSTYLSGKNDIDQIIQTSEYENLDVITSGPIPPNPSELIMRDRMKELIEHLKGEYDYIFIDSAPLGLVTDTMNLMPFANINLIIFRENYALKSYAKDLNSLVERHNLKRIGLILNGSDMSSGSYGYGYGY